MNLWSVGVSVNETVSLSVSKSISCKYAVNKIIFTAICYQKSNNPAR